MAGFFGKWLGTARNYLSDWLGLASVDAEVEEVLPNRVICARSRTKVELVNVTRTVAFDEAKNKIELSDVQRSIILSRSRNKVEING